MFHTIVEAGAVGAGAWAALRYGSGSSSDQMIRPIAAPALAPQHGLNIHFESVPPLTFKEIFLIFATGASFMYGIF
jgi:hypothetical protein